MKTKEEISQVEQCSYLNRQIFEDIPTTTNGFAAAVYSFPDNPKLIFIVYRGSYEARNWYDHNLSIARHNNPTIIQQAIQFAQEVRAQFGDDCEYIVTGFSLGSTQSISAGLAIGARVIAFDCPGYFGPHPGEKSRLVSVYQSYDNVVNWNAPHTLSLFDVYKLELSSRVAERYKEFSERWDLPEHRLLSHLIELAGQAMVAHNIENIHDAIVTQAKAQGLKITEQADKPLLLGVVKPSPPFFQFLQDCRVARDEERGNTNRRQSSNTWAQFLRICSSIRNGDPNTISDMENYFRRSRSGPHVMWKLLIQSFNVDLGKLQRINGPRLIKIALDSPLLTDYSHLFDPLLRSKQPDFHMPEAAWRVLALNPNTSYFHRYVPQPMPANPRALANYVQFTSTPVGAGYGVKFILPDGVEMGIGLAGGEGLIFSIGGALDLETVMAMAPYGLAFAAVAAGLMAASFYYSEQGRRMMRELTTHQRETVDEQKKIKEAIDNLPQIQGTESPELLESARKQYAEALALVEDHISKLHKRAGRAWKFGEDKLTDDYHSQTYNHQEIKNNLEDSARKIAGFQVYAQYIKPIETLDTKELPQAVDKIVADCKYHPDASILFDQLGDLLKRKAFALLASNDLEGARLFLNDISKIQFNLSCKLEPLQATGCEKYANTPYLRKSLYTINQLVADVNNQLVQGEIPGKTLEKLEQCIEKLESDLLAYLRLHPDCQATKTFLSEVSNWKKTVETKKLWLQETSLPTGFEDIISLFSLLDNPDIDSLDCWLDVLQKINELPEERRKADQLIVADFIEVEILKLFAKGNLDEVKAKLNIWATADEMSAERISELNCKIDFAEQNKNKNDAFWSAVLKGEDHDLEGYAAFQLQERAKKYDALDLLGKAANLYKTLAEKYPERPDFFKLSNQHFFGHDQQFISMAVAAFESMLLNYARSNKPSRARSLIEGMNSLNQFTSAVNLNFPKLLAEWLWSKYQGRTEEFNEYFKNILPSLLDNCLVIFGQQCKSKITNLESLITILQVLEVVLILIGKARENNLLNIKFLDRFQRVKLVGDTLARLLSYSPSACIPSVKNIGQALNYCIQLPWTYSEFLANYRLALQTLRAVSSIRNLCRHTEYYGQMCPDMMNIGLAGLNIFSRVYQAICPNANEKYKVVAFDYLLTPTLQMISNIIQSVMLIETRNSKIFHSLAQVASYLYSWFCQYTDDSIRSIALSNAMKHIDKYRKDTPVNTDKIRQSLQNLADELSNKLQYKAGEADFKNAARVYHFNQTVIDLTYDEMIKLTKITDSTFISKKYKIPAVLVLQVIVEQRLTKIMEKDLLNFHAEFTKYMAAVRNSATQEWKDKNPELLENIQKNLITNFFISCINMAIKHQQDPPVAEQYLNLLFLSDAKNHRWKHLLSPDQKYNAGVIYHNMRKHSRAELFFNALNTEDLQAIKPEDTTDNPVQLAELYDETFKTLRNARSEYKEGKKLLKSGERVNAQSFFSRSQSLYQQIRTRDSLHQAEIGKRLEKMRSM